MHSMIQPLFALNRPLVVSLEKADSMMSQGVACLGIFLLQSFDRFLLQV